MRVSLLSHSDLSGGAARAAWRLHRGLADGGCESRMLVASKRSDDPAVRPVRPGGGVRRRTVRRVRRGLRRSPVQYATTPPFEVFSTDRGELTAELLEALAADPPDVLNLHWVAGMFDDAAFLPAAAAICPLVWTLHDMQPFTGGCHYDGPADAPCGRFAKSPGCGRCPQLAGDADRDLSRRVWERRAAAFAKIPTDRLTFVAPSRWLADEVRRSSLCGRFPAEVIPYGLDTDTFRPRDRAAGRDVLGVPADARVVLFVAQGLGNPRKGFDLLLAALEHLRDVPNLFLLALGGGSAAVPADLPHRAVGGVADDRFLSFAYSAADAFVSPARADNLPNTVLESMACGTPAVGFEVGGVPDMIRPGETGLLAEPFDVAALAGAVKTALLDDDLRAAMAAECRRTAEAEYPLRVQAERYVNLYRRVTGRPPAGPATPAAEPAAAGAAA